jgi:hypothetical protein
MKRLHILISAYACEPGKGSEPGVGWNWVMQVARFHEVWVITRANNRQPIEQAMAAQPGPQVHWLYVDLPRWALWWKRGQHGMYLYYYLWQVGAYMLAQRLHREVRFDVVHHLTFGTHWMPSLLALLSVPFVWGPLGGGEYAPRTLSRTFCIRGKIHEVMRRAARWLGERDPLVRPGRAPGRVSPGKGQRNGTAPPRLGGTAGAMLLRSGTDSGGIASAQCLAAPPRAAFSARQHRTSVALERCLFGLDGLCQAAATPGSSALNRGEAHL